MVGKTLTGCLLLLTIVALNQAKVYTRCALTQELINRRFPRSFIGHWVCLVESESGKNTSKIYNKANGSVNLGLFQINNKEWCEYGRQGGNCHVKCEDLLDEDLTDDTACAKQIFSEKGFQSWDGWKRACYGRKLTIPKC
uniref:lysozyme n=1 Tax=Lasioderma serricorne TaxID=295660 RepID=A0A7S9KI69_9COLE|nr:lysc [Lasioderma serricorne]